MKMEDLGFKKIGKKPSCFRIRENIVDVLAIQLGSTGSMNLHYFMNLISDPHAKTLESYRVGHRMQRHPETDVLWYSDTESQAIDHLNSLFDATKVAAIPFFDSVINYKDYAVEIICDLNKKKFSLDLAVALAGCYKYDKVYWLCDDDINALASDEESGSRDELLKNMKMLRHAAHLHDKKKVDDLLSAWKQEKLSSL